MRRTRKGAASRSRNPECRLKSGSVSSQGAGRRSRLQVQIPASEHESATVPTPGFCGSQIISYFCRRLPRGRLRPDGGIGRHAGLKILWPAMAVPVRSRLRVPVKNSKQLIYSCLEFLFYPLCPHFVRISSKVGDVTLIFAFKHGHSIYFRRRAECSGKRDGK